MKKKMMAVLSGIMMTSAILAGCGEETDPNERTTVSIAYSQILDLEEPGNVSDSNYKYTYYFEDAGRTTVENELIGEYTYQKEDAEKVKEFLLKYRIGTLTDMKEAPNEGYVITIGSDKREYEIVEKESGDEFSYENFVKLKLVNGMKIKVLDEYIMKEYKGKKELEKLVKENEKTIEELKKEYGIVEEA